MRMRQRKEAGLKLRRRKINTALPAGVEIFRKRPGIARARIVQRPDFATAEIKTEHRTDPLKNIIAPSLTQSGAHALLKVATQRLEFSPSIDAFQFVQLREARRHRQRISGESARLIHRTVRRKLIHDFRRAAKRADRQTAADDFAQRR